MSDIVFGTVVTEAADLTLSTGNAAEVVFAANPSRKLLVYSNTSDTLQYIRFHATSDAAAAVGISVAAGATVTFTGASCPTSRMTAVCAMDAKTFYAFEGPK